MNLPVITWTIEYKDASDYISDPETRTYEVVAHIGPHEIARVPAPGVTDYSFDYGDDHNDLIAEALAPYFVRLFAPLDNF
jgi:hypothetical protein